MVLLCECLMETSIWIGYNVLKFNWANCLKLVGVLSELLFDYTDKT